MSRVRTNEARDRKRQRRRPAQGIVALNPTRGDTTDAIGVDPIANGPTPGTCAQRREEAELVRAAIDKLPDDIGRQIIVLRFFDELSLQQIAHRTGLSYDKVRERYRACMKLVEQELADLL
jgi:RNA polymerase sigma factor (sigma-70 family)